jgi:hypothetical protein
MMRDTQARTLVISDIGRTLLDNFRVVYRIGIGNFPGSYSPGKRHLRR